MLFNSVILILSKQASVGAQRTGRRGMFQPQTPVSCSLVSCLPMFSYSLSECQRKGDLLQVNGHFRYVYGAINGRLWPYDDTGFLL